MNNSLCTNPLIKQYIQHVSPNALYFLKVNNMVKKTINSKRDRVRNQVLQYLIDRSLEVGADNMPTSSQQEGIQIPLRFFRGFTRDKIIEVCNEISESQSTPFLITHEWSDELRRRDHTIVTYLVDLSLKTSVAALVGCHVLGNWSAFSSFGLFVAEVVEVNPKPFIDLYPPAEPELYLKVKFYRDGHGRLVEPTEHCGVACDRYMLSMMLGRLTQEQLATLKGIMAEGNLDNLGHHAVLVRSS